MAGSRRRIAPSSILSSDIVSTQTISLGQIVQFVPTYLFFERVRYTQKSGNFSGTLLRTRLQSFSIVHLSAMFGYSGAEPVYGTILCPVYLHHVFLISPVWGFIRNIMQVKASAKVSSMEGQLLSWAQMTGTQCADSRQIGEALRFDTVQCRNLLDKMNRRGIIVQLKRGLYLLPQKLPPGGKWQPSADMAIWFFMKYRKAQWQETGATAFNYYGLTEQVANQTVIYNDKVSAKRKFGCLSVVFVKVPASRLGGITELDLPAETEIKRKIGTLARVVLDGIYDYSRFGTLPNAYRWIEARKTDEAFLKELVSLCLRFGNIASRRRIGWLLERLAVSPTTYRPLLMSLCPSMSYIPADPSVPKRGKTNMRWNVVGNYYN